MRILHRYIARSIILATGLITLIMAAILLLILLLGEIKQIGRGDYGIIEVFIYVLSRLPNELYQFFPIIILVGCVTGLSILSAHKELIVMRTSGLTLLRIIFSALSAVLLMTMIMAVIGEGVAPHLSYLAEIRKENQRNAGLAMVTNAGVWLHVDKNFIHIEHVIGRQLMEGITQYQFDDQLHLLAIYHAKKLILEKHHWQMIDVVKTSFYPTELKREQLKTLDWNLKIDLNLLNVGIVDANEMSLTKLAKFSKYLVQNGLQATEYQYEFWHRLLQPISSFLMVFLVVPFILGGINLATSGKRLLFGILSGFVFYILNSALSQLSIVFQLPPMIAAALPLFIFSIFGLYLFKRLQR